MSSGSKSVMAMPEGLVGATDTVGPDPSGEAELMVWWLGGDAVVST